MTRKKLTQERLKELLHYAPLTGVFTWKVRRGGTARRGSVAGTISRPEGYRRILVDKRSYRAHRLAFLYMEGYFPEFGVDHKKGVNDDNRWKELRPTTQSCNMQNCKAHSRNKSGFPGVWWMKRNTCWVATATINYKSRHLGVYGSPLEAALARLTFEVQCPLWTCNHRSELVKAIKKAWPEFNERSLN